MNAWYFLIPDGDSHWALRSARTALSDSSDIVASILKLLQKRRGLEAAYISGSGRLPAGPTAPGPVLDITRRAATELLTRELTRVKLRFEAWEVAGTLPLGPLLGAPALAAASNVGAHALGEARGGATLTLFGGEAAALRKLPERSVWIQGFRPVAVCILALAALVLGQRRARGGLLSRGPSHPWGRTTLLFWTLHTELLCHDKKFEDAVFG